MDGLGILKIDLRKGKRVKLDISRKHGIIQSNKITEYLRCVLELKFKWVLFMLFYLVKTLTANRYKKTTINCVLSLLLCPRIQ